MYVSGWPIYTLMISLIVTLNLTSRLWFIVLKRLEGQGHNQALTVLISLRRKKSIQKKENIKILKIKYVDFRFFSF